jgi:hypothetical protein
VPFAQETRMAMADDDQARKEATMTVDERAIYLK